MPLAAGTVAPLSHRPDLLGISKVHLLPSLCNQASLEDNYQVTQVPWTFTTDA